MNNLEMLKNFINSNMKTLGECNKDDTYYRLCSKLALIYLKLDDKEIESIKSNKPLRDFIILHTTYLNGSITGEESEKLCRLLKQSENH